MTKAKRDFVKMYADVGKLRRAIRAEGTPRIQDAWDRVEQFVDTAMRPDYGTATDQPRNQE